MSGEELTLSTDALKPAGSVDWPVLNGTLVSPLNVPDVSPLGLTGFLGWVFEDSWPVREDMVCMLWWRFLWEVSLFSTSCGEQSVSD